MAAVSATNLFPHAAQAAERTKLCSPKPSAPQKCSSPSLFLEIPNVAAVVCGMNEFSPLLLGQTARIDVRNVG